MLADLFSVQQPHGWKKLLPAVISLLLVLMLGTMDYSIGYKISLLVFYILPVGIATWYASPIYAVVLAILSVVISKGGDLLHGMPYPGNVVFIWNTCIAVSFYLIVIGLLHLLNRARRGLEAKVERRSQDLLQEMTARARLERQITELSERERRQFGQELHDLTSQDLAGIAIDMHLLTRNLLATGQEEAPRARNIASRVDKSLTRARELARGFFTVGFGSTGLAEALREFARRVEKTSRYTCVVHCEENLAITNDEVTMQLFRIAQEAIMNAVRHSVGSRIDLTLEKSGPTLRLLIKDNGKGLPTSQTNGIGLSIMSYRANLIGGELKLDGAAGRGTSVTCTVPMEKLTSPVKAPGVEFHH